MRGTLCPAKVCQSSPFTWFTWKPSRWSDKIYPAELDVISNWLTQNSNVSMTVCVNKDDWKMMQPAQRHTLVCEFILRLHVWHFAMNCLNFRSQKCFYLGKRLKTGSVICISVKQCLVSQSGPAHLDAFNCKAPI